MIKNIGVFLFIILFVACTKDFIEKDIKNSTITIIAPINNFSTPNNSVTFWWEELEGADKYNLQIVKPNFNSVIQLIVDTTITGNKFTKILTPGIYQWRIKALNGGGSTSYITRTLTIDTTSNLSFITLNAISPNNLLTNKNVIEFSWSAHSAANFYEINILSSAGASIYNQSNITTNTFTYTFPPNSGVYKWQVKAHNAFSFSTYNSPNTFTIDLTPPSPAFITHPNYGASVNGNIDSLVWNRDVTATCDSVIVSLDSNFASTPNFASRLYTQKIKFNTLGLPISPSGNNFYWLRVISIDSVRNIAAPSSKFKFKIN